MNWKSLVYLVSLVVLLAGCAIYKETAFLTPIPESTLFAYREDTPIENQLQAVIEARLMLMESRLESQGIPRVIMVEKTTLVKAHQKVGIPRPGDYYYEDRPADTPVWLVFFEGEFRIIPPDPEHKFTPGPFMPGCVWVIKDLHHRGEQGGIECKAIEK